MKERLPRALLAVALAALAWAAWTVTVEYYDGFEYLLTARALLGQRLFSYLRNPALSAYLALVEAPWRAAGSSLGLRGFHVAMLALNAAGAFAAAAWIRRAGVKVPPAAAACVFACNRLFAHYALFAMADMPAAAAVAACLWALAGRPLESRRGRVTFAALLALCALGRPQAAVVPAAAVLVEAWRTRRRREAALVAGLAALGAAAGVALTYRLVGVPFAQGLPDHLRMMSHYLRTVNDSGTEPASDAAVFLFLALTPFGLLLAAVGLWQLRGTQRRPLRAALAGPAAGAAAYALVLFGVAHKDARYLSPLLPFCALAQCLALERLAKLRAWAAPLALAALFASAAPEAARFAEPFYRADRERTLSMDIAAWTGARQFYFFGESAPLHPDAYVFHPDDDYFYVYHWNAAPFMFFTGLPARSVGSAFAPSGWPTPYGVGGMPAGTAAVSPAPAPTPTAKIPEALDVVYAFRSTDKGVERRAFALRAP